jgi:hypothetical protein
MRALDIPLATGPTGALAIAAMLALAAPARGQNFTPVVSADIAAHVSFSTGVSWVDWDHDGDLDLFVVTGFAANNHNVLYRNDAGTFSRLLGVPMAQDGAESVCSTWADFDNDGDVDAFVSNLVNAGGMLYEGHAGAGLTLNTTAGIGGIGLKGTGAAWGDYDNDGDVDLVIAALVGQGGITTPNRLFHNDGDATFTEITAEPPVSMLDSCHHPTWSDYDGDGDLDLFFASGGPGFTKRDQLYRNQLRETGAATFVRITTGVIATDFRDSQVLSWVDYDNDGDLDLYAVNYSSVPNQLYRNDGGTFTKVVAAGIATDAGAAHGVVWGDFDNDGDQDAYVARDLRQSNRYYRNEGDGTFTTVTTGLFVNEALSNYGAAAADYDGDGDLDLFVPTARSEGPSLLLRNDLVPGNHWLVVRCEGTISNRSAIGAKVRAGSRIAGTMRWQLRELLAGTSYGGHNALDAHFGLGDAVVVDSLRIEWPSGLVEVLTGVGVDRRLDVLENSTTPVLGLVLDTAATAGGVQVRWSVPGWAGREVVVQRTRPGGDWSEHGRVLVGAGDIAAFADAAVAAGARYGYRLRLDAPAGAAVVGEAWVDVPAAVGFAISRLWPNPTPGPVHVQFDLASDAPGSLELFDAAGRRVASLPLPGAGAGRHERTLDPPSRLANGVYYVRLRQGARSTTAPIAVAH